MLEGQPVTPGQKVILETVQKELFPQIDKLKDLLVKIQSCRISFQIYSLQLQQIEKEYYIVAKHSETLEELVVYEALYDNPEVKLWVRPKKMFEEEVEVNGEKISRFKFFGK